MSTIDSKLDRAIGALELMDRREEVVSYYGTR